MFNNILKTLLYKLTYTLFFFHERNTLNSTLLSIKNQREGPTFIIQPPQSSLVIRPPSSTESEWENANKTRGISLCLFSFSLATRCNASFSSSSYGIADIKIQGELSSRTRSVRQPPLFLSSSGGHILLLLPELIHHWVLLHECPGGFLSHMYQESNTRVHSS